MDDVATDSIKEAELTARASDELDFVAMYDLYFPRVYTYVRYRVDEAAVADDLAAQAFERALTRLDQFRRERASFKAWLFTIARNVVNDHLRYRQRHPQVPLDAARDWHSEAIQTEEQVVRNESRAEIVEAMAQLSDRERELLSLKFASGMTNRDIAGITRLGEKNVGVILYRALCRLRELLKAKE